MDSPSITSRVVTAIDTRMRERDVSALALSDATGIPRTTLIRRLRGQSPFTLDELAAIADHLDLDVPTLLAEPAVETRATA